MPWKGCVCCGINTACEAEKSAELRTAFPGYKVLYGLFSKSGFTQRMLDQAEGRGDILLIQEDCVL